MQHVRTIVLALALLGLADVASAVTKQWTNAGGTGNGLWTDPLNWNPNGVPASGDTVEIGASLSGGNCTLSTSTTVAGLTILNPGTPPTLTVTGVTLTVSGATSVAAGTTLSATSGASVNLNGGGSSSGQFSSGASSIIAFAGGFTANAGSGFTGSGEFRITSGLFVVPAAASVTIPNLKFSGGYLSGAGTVTLTGAAVWSAGSMGESTQPGGTTIVDSAATLTLPGGGYTYLEQRTLTNNGTIIYTTPSQYLTIQAVSTVNNAGTFDIQSDQLIYIGGAGPNVFSNTGTLQKSLGAGTAAVHARLDNSGTVASTSGTLSLVGGGSSTAAFSAGAGSAIEFASNYTIGAGSTFTGAGGFQVSFGNLVVPAAAAVTIPNFSILNGSSYLSGAGTVTLTGAATWAGGYMGHPSSPGGTTIVDAAGTLTISGSGGYATLDQNRTLTNNGTIDYTAPSLYLSIYNGSTLNNAGTFNIATDQQIYAAGSGPNVINNTGTLQKTSGGATSFLYPQLTNSGTVATIAGTISINGGGASSGAFSAGAGTNIDFASTYTANAGSSFGGAGNYRLNNGNLVVPGAASISIANLAIMTSGSYLSGAGTVTLTGAVTWTAGSMGIASAPGGTTIIDPGATVAINGSYTYLDQARTLTNNGTINYTPTGSYLSIYNGSTLNNAGTFNIQNDQGIVSAGTGTNSFNNSGTLQKTAGSGTSTITALLNNTGSLTSSAGELALNGGGTHSGAFSAGTGAILTFGGGTHAIGATSTVSAAGVIRFSGGTADIAGTYNVAGTTRVSGGTARFNAAASTAVLELSGGDLGGTGTFTVMTSGTWSGGYMSGPGTTVVDAGAALTMGGSSTYSYLASARVLTNNGTFVYAPAPYYLSQYGGSTINNAGLFDVQTDQGIVISGAGNVFNNSGTLRKSGTAGASNFGVAVNNTGLVDVLTGTLSLQGGGTASGTFTFAVSTAANLDFASTYTVSSGGTFSGPGNFRIINGNLVVGAAATTIPNLSILAGGSYLSGSGTVTLTGTATWAAGYMGHSSNPGGTTIIDSTATLNMTNGSYKYLDQGRTLTNNGTINYNVPSYYLSINNGSTLNNAGTFDIQSDTGVSWSGAGSVFNNSGTLQKTGGTGTSDFTVRVNNTGSVSVSSGTLSFNGGGTHSGVFTPAATGTVRFGGGTHASAGGTYSGPGTFAFTGGDVTLSGTTIYNATSTQVTGATVVINVNGTTVALAQSGGYLGGTGTFTITGSATWSGGTWGEPSNPGGTTVIDPGVTVLLNGASTYSYLGYGRTLNNNGTITYTAPAYYLNFYLGGTLNNAGTFELQTDQGLVQSGTGNLFSNAGTLQKTVGTGVAIISVPLNNTGSVIVSAGTLSLNAGGTHSGSFSATAPGTMQFGGGTHSSSAGAYGGTGTTLFSNGNVTLSGTTTYSAAATQVTSGTAVLNVNGSTVSLNQSGGYLGGTGTFTITGSATWSGGTWGEPSNLGGTTVINPGVTVLLNGASTYSYLGYGRTLNNNGTITYTAPAYYLNFYVGGTLNNAGTFDMQTDQGILASGTGNLFSNTSVLQKTAGTGVSTISVPLNNSGSVLASTGTLSLSGGGTHSGSFNATAPGAVQFNGGNHSSPSGSYAGTGLFLFSSGNVLLSGTTTYNSAATRVTNGTAVFNVDATTSSLEQTGGYLGGTGTFTIAGSATWSGGTWGEPVNTGGTTVIDPAAAVLLDGSSTYSYLGYGRTLVNNGSITYSAPTYYLTFYQGGTLNNAGTIDVMTDQGFAVSGSTNQLNNSGTFRKSAGAATSTFSVPFANSGLVEALGGISAFNGGYTQTAGLLTLNGGGVSSTTPLNIQGGIVGGTGTIAATVSNSGGTMKPGLSPGTLSISGNYSQGTAGALEIEIAGAASSDLLAISGTATLDGSLSVLNIGGYTPANGAGFQIVSYSTRSGDFATKAGLSYVGGAYTYNLNATDITLTAGSTADVTVAKTAPGTVAINQTFDYTIVVSNLSSIDAATDVTLTDDLSAAGVVLNSITPPPGWTCAGTTTVTCTTTLLGASSSASFTFNVTAPSSNGSITNTASVASVNEPASNNTNNSSAATTSVVAIQADVSVTVTSIGSTTAGNPIVYTLSAVNAGPVAATNVVVTASIPPGVTAVSFTTAPSTSCAPSGLNVVCTFTSIAAGGSANITISSTAADGGSMTVKASASASEPDPNTANNSGSSTTIVTGSNTLVVRVIADSGSSSLRQALMDVQNGVCVVPCTITFAIPGAGPHAIAPLSALPSGTSSNVTIDGATQPGYSGAPLIQLDGSGLASGVSGLQIFGNNWTVRAIALHSVPAYGIFFSGGSGHTVVDNYVGTNGSIDLGNQYDGLLFGNGSASNTIRGNVISGNGGGIRIFGASSGNLIAANLIGVGADGSTPVPNANYGILFQTSATGTVGGLTPADSNTIASNGAQGVLIETGISGVEILGNSFSANGGLAIDDGAGTGAPPTPSIASAELSGGNLHVTLSADGTAASGTSALRVELYQADSLASAEGSQLLATVCRTGNLLTNAIITVPASSTVPGTPIVATATPYSGTSCSGITGNTSEFSAAVAAAACTPPAVTIAASGPTTFCAPGTVTLTANPAGLTYLWSTGATTQSITVSATGNYTVTATNALGCAASASQSVTVNPVPATPVVTASGPTTFCTGGSVTLTAPASASYLWSNGATTQSITVTASGSYGVTVSSPSGCSASSAPVSVTVNPLPPAPTITASGPTTFCQGGSVTLTASAGSSWLWSNGATTQSITVISGGNYSVTIADGNGCTSTSAPTPVTVTSPPIVRISGPSSMCGAGTATLTVEGSGISSVTWSTGATTTSITVAPTSTTTYSAVVVTGSCTTTVSHTITVSNAGPPLSISAPASVPALSAGNVASVPGGTTESYSWSIFNGTITSGQGTPAITFTAGASGAVTLNVTMESSGCPSNGTTTIAIESCATVPPSLISPAPGIASAQSPVTFVWSAVAGAIDYEVWRVVPGSSPALIGATASTSLSADVPSGSFGWYVTARLQQSCNPQRLTSAEVRAITVVPATNCPTLAPALVSPANGATPFSPVLFDWTGVPEAIGYRVMVSLAGLPPIELDSTDGDTTDLIAEVPVGAVSWWVEAIYPGCPPVASTIGEFRVELEDCSKHERARLISPSDNAVADSSAVTFSWGAVDGADGYAVWAVLEDGPSKIGETLGATSLIAVVPFGRREWYVETLFEGCPSTESDHRFLVVPASANCSTTPPELTGPAAGATVSSPHVTFTWSSVSGAVLYEIWLSVGGGAEALIGRTTASSIATEVPAGAITWFVRARLNGCPNVDSARRELRYEPPTGCSTMVPMPLLPMDDGRPITSPVAFRWTAVPGAAQYKLYLGRGASGVFELKATTSVPEANGIVVSNGESRWFVEAIFNGCPSTRSSNSRFVAVPIPTSCIDLAAPVISLPGQISAGTPYTVQWTAVPGAESYLLTEFIGSTARTMTINGQSAQFIYNNQSSDGHMYVYRVRGVDQDCDPPREGALSTELGISILPERSPESSALVGSQSTVQHTITIGAERAGQTFVASGSQPWITIAPSTGVVPGGGIDLVATADVTGLPLGTSIGTVSITFGGGAGSRQVTTATGPVTTPISVSLVTPVTPTPKSTPPPDALIIPAVAHADGINAQFRSDVRVSNTSPQVMKYQLTFVPSGETGITQGRQTTLDIEPGRTIALDDVLRSWFGTGDSSILGTLEIRPLTQSNSATSSAATRGVPNFVTFASSRTFNQTPSGTFGTYIAAIPFANFIGRSTDSAKSVLSMQQIAQSGVYRSNLGFVEGSGNPAELLVSVFASNGTKVSDFPVSLTGGQHLQMNSFLAERGIQLDDGRLEVQVTSGTGRVTSYASVVNNATGDSLVVTPTTLGQTTSTRYVLPGVAELSGGVVWQTDMRLFNAGAEPVTATLTFQSLNGSPQQQASVQLAAGEVKQLDRVLATLFGVANDGGALHITTESESKLIATARTFRPAGDGANFGQFIQAVTPEQAIALGSRPLQLLQVEESSRFRSNVGIAEVSGRSAKVELTVIPPDSKVSAKIEVDLAANQFRQLNSLLSAIGLRDTHNARVTVKVTAGQGRVTAYAATIDALTQDPTFIPAQ